MFISDLFLTESIKLHVQHLKDSLSQPFRPHHNKKPRFRLSHLGVNLKSSDKVNIKSRSDQLIFKESRVALGKVHQIADY